MQTSPETLAFIRSTFRSIWALELFLHLKRSPSRSFAPDELVDELRASEHVVATSLRMLVAAGLVVSEEDGRSRYAPASTNLALQGDEVEGLYFTRPTFIRRTIVTAPAGGAVTFANAFLIKKD